MQKQIIVEDSSFVISVFHKGEPFHKNSVQLMTEILARKNKARIIIPSVVFFETIFNLCKIGISRKQIEEKLWKLLFHDQVFNISLVETSAFRLFKKFPKDNLQAFKTIDFLVVSTALAFDACLLTYDKGIRKNAGKIYPKIYYCADSKEFSNETDKFLDELRKG